MTTLYPTAEAMYTGGEEGTIATRCNRAHDQIPEGRKASGEGETEERAREGGSELDPVARLPQIDDDEPRPLLGGRRRPRGGERRERKLELQWDGLEGLLGRRGREGSHGIKYSGGED
jgi:hypothetical protein